MLNVAENTAPKIPSNHNNQYQIAKVYTFFDKFKRELNHRIFSSSKKIVKRWSSIDYAISRQREERQIFPSLHF